MCMLTHTHAHTNHTNKNQKAQEPSVSCVIPCTPETVAIFSGALQTSEQHLSDLQKWLLSCRWQSWAWPWERSAVFCKLSLPCCSLTWRVYWRREAAWSVDLLPLVRQACNWECWVMQSVQRQTGLLRKRLEQGKTAPLKPRCEPGCLQTELDWRLLGAARETVS